MEHRYSVYGISLRSDTPFDFPVEAAATTPAPEVRFARGGHEHFGDALPGEAADDWFVCRELGDGSVYFRWSGLYEFRVDATGSSVRYRPIGSTEPRVLQNFLFGQALSFALVRQDVEPVHAAVVDVGGEAIALLGDCTYGKSTLGCAFLAGGCRLLTDDVLVVRRQDGRLLAQPGTGRIKLMIDGARAMLPGRGGTPVIPGAGKHAFKLDDRMVQRDAIPLRAFCVLPSPDERAGCTSIEVVPISRRRLFHELVKNTYVRHVADARRLRQNFAANALIAGAVEGYALRYPPGIHRLSHVVTTVIERVRGRLQGEVA